MKSLLESPSNSKLLSLYTEVSYEIDNSKKDRPQTVAGMAYGDLQKIIRQGVGLHINAYLSSEIVENSAPYPQEMYRLQMMSHLIKKAERYRFFRKAQELRDQGDKPVFGDEDLYLLKDKHRDRVRGFFKQRFPKGVEDSVEDLVTLAGLVVATGGNLLVWEEGVKAIKTPETRQWFSQKFFGEYILDRAVGSESGENPWLFFREDSVPYNQETKFKEILQSILGSPIKKSVEIKKVNNKFIGGLFKKTSRVRIEGSKGSLISPERSVESKFDPRQVLKTLVFKKIDPVFLAAEDSMKIIWISIIRMLINQNKGSKGHDFKCNANLLLLVEKRLVQSRLFNKQSTLFHNDSQEKIMKTVALMDSEIIPEDRLEEVIDYMDSGWFLWGSLSIESKEKVAATTLRLKNRLRLRLMKNPETRLKGVFGRGS